jgi:hypothetical protein
MLDAQVALDAATSAVHASTEVGVGQPCAHVSPGADGGCAERVAGSGAEATVKGTVALAGAAVLDGSPMDHDVAGPARVVSQGADPPASGPSATWGLPQAVNAACDPCSTVANGGPAAVLAVEEATVPGSALSRGAVGGELGQPPQEAVQPPLSQTADADEPVLELVPSASVQARMRKRSSAVNITVADFQCARPTEFLNDSLIEMFLKYVPPFSTAAGLLCNFLCAWGEGGWCTREAR